MMGGRVRIGVIGCSSVAWRRTLPAIAAGPHTTVQAVASRDPEKAKRFATQFDCVATSYDELLERDDVDAVYLPLPTSLHASWGTRVLRAGKHLLLEKPAATTAAEAEELVRTAGECGLVLRENFTFLYHSQHAKVRELIEAGRLGEVRSLSAAFCFPPLPPTDIRYAPELGGGSLLDAGVYPIRLAQLLFGDELTVAGASIRMDEARGVDVAGQALLLSRDGVLVTVQFGFEHTYGSRYSVWGSTGHLSVDKAFTPLPSWQPVIRIDGQNHGEELVLPADDQFARSVASFAQAIVEGRTALDPAEARRCRQTVRTMELVGTVQRQAIRVPTRS